jgi:hypothetical protein
MFVMYSFFKPLKYFLIYWVRRRKKTRTEWIMKFSFLSSPISYSSRLLMISGESECEDLLHPFPALFPRGVQPGGHQGVLRQENSLR